jgi:hypothetical protein
MLKRRPKGRIPIRDKGSYPPRAGATRAKVFAGRRSSPPACCNRWRPGMAALQV